MERFKIIISSSVKNDLEEIVSYLKAINTYSAALRFRKSLIENIRSLQHTANSYSTSTYETALQYHPQAKTIFSDNKNWTIIFFTEGEYCHVVKILPSKMIV